MKNMVKNVVVFGANGAIGNAFCAHYAQDKSVKVTGVSRSHPDRKLDNVICKTVAYDDGNAFADLAKSIVEGHTPDIIIVAVGALCIEDKFPEKSFRDINAQYISELFYINTIVPTLIMKHMLPLMPREKQFVFAALSARVGSIEDNRLGGWYGYRASKAALNMMIKTASIEVARKNNSAIIVGLHPGTVDSNLSEPFQANVPEGRLFSPDQSASNLASVIDSLTTSNTGQVFDYKGEVVEP